MATTKPSSLFLQPKCDYFPWLAIRRGCSRGCPMSHWWSVSVLLQLWFSTAGWKRLSPSECITRRYQSFLGVIVILGTSALPWLTATTICLANWMATLEAAVRLHTLATHQLERLIEPVHLSHFALHYIRLRVLTEAPLLLHSARARSIRPKGGRKDLFNYTIRRITFWQTLLQHGPLSTRLQWLFSLMSRQKD